MKGRPTSYYDTNQQPQLVTKAVAGERVLGYVVIDSPFRGHAHGGLRIAADMSESEIRELARTMTLKYGFLGLPFGGAKAGLLGEPDDSAELHRRGLIPRRLVGALALPYFERRLA